MKPGANLRPPKPPLDIDAARTRDPQKTSRKEVAALGRIMGASFKGRA